MFELQSFGQKKFWGRRVDEQILEIGSNRVVAEAGRIISNKISSRQDLQNIDEMALRVDGQSETVIGEGIQEGEQKEGILETSWTLGIECANSDLVGGCLYFCVFS